MARAVLISIRPGWVNKIISGEKTVEIRKNRPNLETPFKVYIYCTDGFGKNTVNIPITQEQLWKHYAETGSMECLNCPIGNQKVVGEFVCDRITDITLESLPHPELDGEWTEYWYEWQEEDLELKSCLTYKQIEEYLNRKNGYAWHISNLKIYDSPKELTEFHILKKCKSCSKSEYESTACTYDENCMVPAVITKAPQSWCFVEGLTDD